jgi:hypothetical protein
VSGEADRLFALSIDMLCIAGFDGYLKKLNPACSQTLGFTNEELTARDARPRALSHRLRESEPDSLPLRCPA